MSSCYPRLKFGPVCLTSGAVKVLTTVRLQHQYRSSPCEVVLYQLRCALVQNASPRCHRTSSFLSLWFSYSIQALQMPSVPLHSNPRARSWAALLDLWSEFRSVDMSDMREHRLRSLCRRSRLQVGSMRLDNSLDYTMRFRHFENTSHTFCLQVGGQRVWDYAGDNYVHRLIQSDTEGKVVEYQRGGPDVGRL